MTSKISTCPDERSGTREHFLFEANGMPYEFNEGAPGCVRDFQITSVECLENFVPICRKWYYR